MIENKINEIFDVLEPMGEGTSSKEKGLICYLKGRSLGYIF